MVDKKKAAEEIQEKRRKLEELKKQPPGPKMRKQGKIKVVVR